VGQGSSSGKVIAGRYVVPLLVGSVVLLAAVARAHHELVYVHALTVGVVLVAGRLQQEHVFLGLAVFSVAVMLVDIVSRPDIALVTAAVVAAVCTMLHAVAVTLMFTLGQHLQKLKIRETELEALYNLTATLSNTQSVESFLDQAVHLLGRELDFTHISVLLYDEQNQELVVRAVVGYGNERMIKRIPLDRGITGLAATTGKTVVVDDVLKEERYVAGDPAIRSEVAIPLTTEGRLLGVLNVESTKYAAFSPRDVRLLELIANELTVLLIRAQLVERLRVQAITDELTGLYNHRYFNIRLRSEVERAERYCHPLSLLMIDIDHFKLVNDRHGHLVGDEVLHQLGSIIRRQLREADVVCRYGGEEFAVILPETDGQAALTVAERIRAAIQREVLLVSLRGDNKPTNLYIPVTVSIGVASYPQNGSDWSTLLAAADAALYAAKQAGRNRVRQAA